MRVITQNQILVVYKSSVSTRQSIVPKAFERKTRVNEGNILRNSLHDRPIWPLDFNVLFYLVVEWLWLSSFFYMIQYSLGQHFSTH
ncbi:hypothetical protein BCV71DRAFT_99151 [Rhizopus microsporus]|uniref:Uncharacterized protein n=1 Tax=Rhizopus microsporus TaxID=58291 RepID=A0A1X0S5M9_RHIZD|nr:hypothetical protein BCV71DRAFT_99151 [Rhizopus microsporus]